MIYPRSIEGRALKALIDWRKEETVKHKSDCDCELCVKLGALADKLIAQRERREVSP